MASCDDAKESLFMRDENDRINLDYDLDSNNDTAFFDDEVGENVDSFDVYDEEKLDRVAQFQNAFETAKEIDTPRCLLQQITAINNLPQNTSSASTSSATKCLRTLQDLNAISWAAFCTGEKGDVKRDVYKIQALDMTNVLQRLHLAAAMLREEKKRWRAKLALMGIKEDDNGLDSGEGL